MVQALVPGSRNSPHFNYNPDTIPAHIRTVKSLGGIPQVGKLIAPGMTPQVISEIRELLE